MAHRGRPKTKLPLPRSWSHRQKWEGESLSVQEIALNGRFPRPGTKGHLRSLLLAAGWEDDEIESKSLSSVRSKLFDLHTELVAKKSSLNLDRMASDLRKKGIAVDPVLREKGKSPNNWVSTVWESLSSNPWWSATKAGSKSLVIVSSSYEKAKQGSALFITDVWRSLGSIPEHRMPTFRRINLITLMNPESLSHFMSNSGSSTDLLVVYGGFLNESSLYENFSYLSAVQSVFKGFLLYEAVAPMNEDVASIARVSKRSGFSTVLGVL